LLCASGLPCPSPGRAQSEGQRTVEILHAEELQGQVIDGLTYRKLIGRVAIRQGDVLLRCDSAVHIVEREEIRLYGRIQIVQPRDTLWAGQIRYDHKRRIAEAFGPLRYSDGIVRIEGRQARYDYSRKWLEIPSPLRLEDTSFVVESRGAFYETETKRALLVGSVILRGIRDSLYVQADTLEYWREEDRTRASGRVFGHLPRENVYVEGPRIWVERRHRRLRAEGFPTWVRIEDGERPDTLALRAEWVEAVELDSVHTRLEAAGNLELVSRELMARAERLQGLRRRDSDVWRDSLWLLGRPRIWLRQSWLVADSIWIASREGRPDSTWLHGRVLLLEQDTLLRRWHQARAERMRAVFADTSLAALDLLEGAEVLYFLRRDSIAEGAVQIAARQIGLRFSEGRLSALHIPGSSEGTYYPEEALRGEPPSLPGMPQRPENPPAWRVRLESGRILLKDRIPGVSGTLPER
jgi:hypothetical protein